MRSFLVLGPLLGLLLGCTAAKTGPAVEGVVTLDSQPLANANVQLIPHGENMAQTGFGKTDAAGKFVIGSSDGKQKGTPAGEYRVVISKHVKPDGSDYIPKPDEDPMLATYKELLPAVYSDQAQSQLRADVPAGGTKSLEFKLNSKAK